MPKKKEHKETRRTPFAFVLLAPLSGSNDEPTRVSAPGENGAIRGLLVFPVLRV